MKPKSSRPEARADSHGPSQRQLRVGEEIRHLLAELFARTEFDDPELSKAHLTVSEVRVSPDLKHANAFVAALGNRDTTHLLPALRKVAPYLRSRIAARLTLRIAPELKFLPDTALDEATKINDLLHSPEVARDLG